MELEELRVKKRCRGKIDELKAFDASNQRVFNNEQ
jgi:hypothetical protein